MERRRICLSCAHGLCKCIHVYSPEIREVCDSKKDAIFKDLTIVRKKVFLEDLILLVINAFYRYSKPLNVT